MTSYTMDIVQKDSPGHNEILRQEMIGVLKHAYIHPEKVIDKRYRALNKLFLLRKEGKLEGFCTYTLIELKFHDTMVPSVYLGIMAASPSIQNSGLVLKTMEAMVNDIRHSNPDGSPPRLVWGTTASPSSLAIFRRYFTDVSPDDNGMIKHEYVEYEKAMRSILLQGAPDSDSPPLVIRAVAPLSAYSALEKDRIKALKQKKPGNIFDSYDIDDTRGDRLIMIGRSH